jgi:hypothetical protein
MRRRIGLLAHAVARAIMRRWLPHTERKRRIALEGAFTAIKNQAIKNEDGHFPAVSTFLGIGLYLLIAERDVQALKIDALTHPDEWKRKLCARIILLTIYEWDADKVSGRALKDALESIQSTEQLKQDTITALKSLRIVQNKIRKKYRFTRNASIAHRDANALLQYRSIRDLKVDDVMAIAVEFYSAAEQFMIVLPKLMIASSTLPALLRQWKPRLER